jgi:hypothetical protein
MQHCTKHWQTYTPASAAAAAAGSASNGVKIAVSLDQAA